MVRVFTKQFEVSRGRILRRELYVASYEAVGSAAEQHRAGMVTVLGLTNPKVRFFEPNKARALLLLAERNVIDSEVCGRFFSGTLKVVTEERDDTLSLSELKSHLKVHGDLARGLWGYLTLKTDAYEMRSAIDAAEQQALLAEMERIERMKRDRLAAYEKDDLAGVF